MNLEDIDKFVIRWNNQFPIDRWWRQKHQVAFLSPEHKEISFLAELAEFREDRLFNKQNAEETQEYIPNTGNWLKREFNKEEFSKFDIEEFRKEADMLREEGNG